MMSEEPKLPLYTEAMSIGDRPEIAAISGRRVSIIARSRNESDGWHYSVVLSVLQVKQFKVDKL